MSPQRTSTTMELLPLVCLCLLSCSGDGVRVLVEEDSDAVLPCLISTEDLEGKLFDWKKDGQKEVFMYDAGVHYNNGRPGQHEQFKGRVSHFQDQLQNGNASIKITRTKMADSGNYSCDFPRLQPRQTSIIELVVDPVLKDRTGENIPDAVSKPSVTIVRTGGVRVLQCKVLGASPKPKVEWRDSSGNILQAEEPQVTERGGSYDIVLQAALTKTDTFSCVVTQEKIHHQISAEIAAVVPAVRVLVEEGSDAVLPCLISTEDLEGNRFDWKKDGQKEVFMYDAGVHHNNGRPGQDEQFKGRVSHFQDQLQNGNASIKITRTKMADSGIYSCDFPRLQSQTFYIELVVDPRVKVVVKEGSDAVLNCSISTKENITGKAFDWKKGSEDVFFHASAGHTTQGPQFIDRVSHFQDQLKNGNASIKINNTKMADSGIYSCIFPHLQSQTFYIKLDVVFGAAPEPTIHRPRDTKDSSLLQCEAHGVPPLKVEWKDSVGNILKNESTPKSEKGDRSSITLNITVTKTDNYRCVATQKKISHQIFAETSVYIQGASEPYVTTLMTGYVRMLLCEVRGVSPKPKVEWKDSSGNVLPVKDLEETESGDIILRAAVTKTDNFRCVVTLEGSDSPLSAEIHADLPVPPPVPGWPIGVIITVVVLILLLLVGCGWCYKKRRDMKKKLLRMPNARPGELHHLECSTPNRGEIIFDEKESE